MSNSNYETPQCRVSYGSEQIIFKRDRSYLDAKFRVKTNTTESDSYVFLMEIAAWKAESIKPSVTPDPTTVTLGGKFWTSKAACGALALIVDT